MGVLGSDELRLLYALVLNAAVFWAAYRVARRVSGDRLGALGDGFLLFYLVQYGAVCLMGLGGVLHAFTMAGTALVAAAVMWAITARTSPVTGVELAPRERAVVVIAVFFVLGYLAALVYWQRYLPVMSNDALTYHLPAAVQWLQTGRLGLYPAWFYNPANSYSPLAGSAFIAWLIAPMRNDVLARFVEVGPLLMLFVGMLNLLRRVGMNAGAAGLLAAATVLARPFVSQTILAKDDLFVAAFFVALAGALAPEKAQEKFGPWRIGIALGLLLATKYTALLALPIVLLAMDAMAWRRWLIAVACAMALAGPWYVRNAVLTGNPLYPMTLAAGSLVLLGGMVHAQRSALLATPAGVWSVFAKGYYSAPMAVNLALVAGWLVAAARSTLRDPMVRVVVLGPVLGIAIFALTAPYGEMRFAYPALVLLFACVGLAIAWMPRVVQLSVATAGALVCAALAIRWEQAWMFCSVGAVAAALGLVASRVWRLAAIASLLAAGLAVYVYWHAYVEQYREDGTYIGWQSQYGAISEGWRFVREQLPPKGTIAYANTYLVYPLSGFRYSHEIVYVPTRRGLGDFLDMPPLPGRMTGEEIPGRICAMLRENPDRAGWARRLKRSGAEYLFVALYDPAEPTKAMRPVELEWAEAEPKRFERIFVNDAAVVFRVRWE